LIIHISTYPPEKCGLALYTHDLVRYFSIVNPTKTHKVLAVRAYCKEPYGEDVIFQMERDNRESYRAAANFLNDNERVKAVSLQHEFGIFGGKGGSYVIDLVDSLEKPLLTTYHSVLPGSSKLRRNILRRIVKASRKNIVLSEVAKRVLVEECHANEGSVEVIHHGIHDFQEDPELSKKKLGLEGKLVLSTVGFVGRGKGIEHAIRALPAVVDKHPNVLYVVAGCTHPSEIEREKGYRRILMREAARRGLQKHVLFIDKYLPLDEHLRLIQMSDICLTPYVEYNKTSSGVLSYCIGLMKPVVSSPFLYAQEVLAEGRGVLAWPTDYRIFAECINRLINNSDIRNAIKEKLRDYREHMRWVNVAKRYSELLEEIVE
jgi:glycosyltransferase involved in cell wall biosynthesis